MPRQPAWMLGGGRLILSFFAWTLKQKRMRGTAKAESKQERRLLRNPVGVCHRRARSAEEDPVEGAGGGGVGGDPEQHQTNAKHSAKIRRF